MSRQADPFRDPVDPFRDPARYGPAGQHAASAAGSQADLLNSMPMNEMAPPVSVVRTLLGYGRMKVAHAVTGQPVRQIRQREYPHLPSIMYLTVRLADKWSNPIMDATWREATEHGGEGLPQDMDHRPPRGLARRCRVNDARFRCAPDETDDACSVAVPLALHFTKTSASASKPSTPNADGLYTNVPKMPGFPTLIDASTPQDAYTSTSLQDNSAYTLVFSDEFNTENRSFYPGDDPFWEGADLHYWQTGDLEWYEPGQLTTKDGALEITLAHFDDITQNYNLSYRSGLMSTWNKVRFCLRYNSSRLIRALLVLLHGRTL